jgi:VIT1/CCC1 family predicted Fe2+/Mn2+ transporter
MGSFKPGLPVTMSARAKTAVKSVVVIAVTAAATGFIGGKIGKK